MTSEGEPIEIGMEACECPDEDCKHELEQAHCVAYMARAGVVKTEPCDTCDSTTWHKDGRCLRCGHED